LGAARANNVIDEWNLRSSGVAKISSIVRPSTATTSAAQSLSLDPRISCAR